MLKLSLRSGFSYMVQQLQRMSTYYEMPNVKRDDTKRNSDFKWQTGGK